jgi:hypothetical protein
MSKGPKGAADFLMPRANSARGKVLGALPRSPARGTPPETPAPFPFAPIFQNGPRRPGFAGENLFNPRKDSPPPRLKRAPWTAAGRSEDLLVTRERGQMQRSTPPQPAVACRLPLAGPDRREMIVVDQTSTGGNHPKQVYRFQDHLVLETLLHFRIILGLEYARVMPIMPIRGRGQGAEAGAGGQGLGFACGCPSRVDCIRNASPEDANPTSSPARACWPPAPGPTRGRTSGRTATLRSPRRERRRCRRWA